MPEFILDTGDTEQHDLYDRLPEIAQGFIEAACFCGLSDDGTGEEFQPGVGDLAPDTLAGLAGEAMRFAKAQAALLEQACVVEGYDMTRAGHDLWYSCNGHGTGFWDRDLGNVGDALHTASKSVGEIDLFRDGDGPVTLGSSLEPFDPADLTKESLPTVGGRYGAPMGRDTFEGDATEPVTARRVRLDAGGYDAGGAYWGIGQPLFRIEAADESPLRYIRAATAAEAIVQFSNGGK